MAEDDRQMTDRCCRQIVINNESYQKIGWLYVVSFAFRAGKTRLTHYEPIDC